MALIYASATDHFNLRGFKINRPAYYDPAVQSCKAITSGEVRPIYMPDVPDARVYSLMPCCDLMDMAVSRVPFEIINDRDVLEILHTCDNYLMEIRQQVEAGSYLHVSVAKNVAILRSKIYRLFRTVLNRHPDWKEKYIHGQGSAVLRDFLKLATLMLGTSEQETFNPIENLRNPPYKIPELSTPGKPVAPIKRDQTLLEEVIEHQPSIRFNMDI